MLQLKAVGVTVYEGPNIFAPYPVIRYRFQLIGAENHVSPKLMSDFTKLISEPGRAKVNVSFEDDYVASQPERVLFQLYSENVLELQRQAGDEKDVALIRRDPETKNWECILPFSIKIVARKAATECYLLLNQVLEKGLDRDTFALLQKTLPPIQMRLRNLFDTYDLAEPTTEFIRIANRRKIPFKRLPGKKQVLHFGYGKNRRSSNRVILSTESHLAAEIANNKELTTKVLAEAGLPVARQIIVRSEQGALKAAKNIGYPVAIKPLVGMMGNGVSPKVTAAEDVPEAFANAGINNNQVIVEEHIIGEDYRLQVIGEKYAFGLLRTRAQVIGDGVSSIGELAEIINDEPWRRDHRGNLIYGLKQTESSRRCMDKQGADWNTIPAKGEVIFLQDVANTSQGGGFQDLKGNIHPANVRLAEMAARVVGLQIAGVDFLTNDITKPYWETGGKICEVNIQAGIDGMSPDPENSGFHFEQVFSLMFPEGTRTAIPMVVILEDGPSKTVAALNDVFKSQNLMVGRKTTTEVSIGNNLLVDVMGNAASEAVLWNPMIDAAIIQETAKSIEAYGLAYSVSECVILPRMPSNNDPETVKKILSTLTQTAVQAVVYNTDDKQLSDWVRSNDQERYYPVSLTTISEVFCDPQYIEKIIGRKEKTEQMAILLALRAAEIMDIPLSASSFD